jgi:hypothetical protein
VEVVYCFAEFRHYPRQDLAVVRLLLDQNNFRYMGLPIRWSGGCCCGRWSCVAFKRRKSRPRLGKQVHNGWSWLSLGLVLESRENFTLDDQTLGRRRNFGRWLPPFLNLPMWSNRGWLER